MHLRSPAFTDGTEIPAEYTVDGRNVSPPLEWDDVPPGTRSLALLVEDPDVEPTPWIHWLIVDLPPDTTNLPEGVGKLPKGVFGTNDWNHTGYGGPSPPRGRHHYVFKLFALDREIHKDEPTKYDLDRALSSAIVLAEAKLVGTYQRRKAA